MTGAYEIFVLCQLIQGDVVGIVHFQIRQQVVDQLMVFRFPFFLTDFTKDHLDILPQFAKLMKLIEIHFEIKEKIIPRAGLFLYFLVIGSPKPGKQFDDSVV